MPPRILLILVVFVASGIRDSAGDDLADLDRRTDTSDWVDPNDIGIQGRLKQVGQKVGPGVRVGSSSSQQQQRETARQEEDPSRRHGSMVDKIRECTNCADVQRKLSLCQKRLEQRKEDEESTTTSYCSRIAEEQDPETMPEECPEKSFFQRYVRFFLNQVSSGKVRATLQLSPGDVAILKRFASLDSTHNNLAEVDRVLSGAFQKVENPAEDGAVEESSYSPGLLTGWLLYSAQDVFWLALALSVLVPLWLLGSGRLPLWQLLLLLLVLSSAWHWTHMYKRALAKKHATLSETTNSVPPECFPDRLSWHQTLYNSVFGNSEARCAKYYDAVMVDPFWEVSPTMALAETVSKLVLHPLEHLGLSLGKFFNSLLRESSWVAAPVILVFSFVAFLLCLVMLFGYRFRLPFFLGSLERDRPNPPVKEQSPAHFRELQEEIKILRSELKSSEKMRQIKLEDYPALVRAKETTEQLPRSLSEVASSSSRVEEVPVPLPSTPVKRLVAKGCLSSPGETEFEWVEAAASSHKSLNFRRDEDSQNNPEMTKKTAEQILMEGRESDFIKKVETLFSVEPQEDIDIGTDINDSIKNDENKSTAS